MLVPIADNRLTAKVAVDGLRGLARRRRLKKRRGTGAERLEALVVAKVFCLAVPNDVVLALHNL